MVIIVIVGADVTLQEDPRSLLPVTGWVYHEKQLLMVNACIVKGDWG